MSNFSGVRLTWPLLLGATWGDGFCVKFYKFLMWNSEDASFPVCTLTSVLMWVPVRAFNALILHHNLPIISATCFELGTDTNCVTIGLGAVTLYMFSASNNPIVGAGIIFFYLNVATFRIFLSSLNLRNW